MSEQIDALNERFGIGSQLQFFKGRDGLPAVRIDNAQATAEVYLHGAHITAFQPRGHEPVLWMSPLAQFQAGKAIRGGVPVIWPWFGPHASDPGKPQHGFARTADWQVVAAEPLADDGTRLQLELGDDPATRALWPHAFALSLSITVASELKIELTCRNTGDRPFTAGGALHSYFAIGDVAQMSIEGLAGREYIDQLDGNKLKPQTDEVRITAAMDRIYVDSADTCIIHDALLGRDIIIDKTGSHTTVVWNPWNEKARAMADFSDEGYQNMVCIEAANAAEDVVQLAPGEAHTLSQIIAISTGR